MGKVYNEILREKLYEQGLKKLTSKYPRFPELEQAIDWELARFTLQRTHLYYEIEADVFLWIMEGLNQPNFPSVAIVFKYVYPKICEIIEHIFSD